ncbi:MAG: hypothetical protein IT299_05975 [Dehalococcoidia bacterium]|nr:hypothetical protein [Dehalococcoidia bacterium]
MIAIRRIGLLVGAASALVLGACADSEARTSSTGTASKTATASDASTATSTSTQNATAESAPQVLFVANTGGTGVSLRTRCEDAARVAGPGLKDGTEVAVTTVGSGACSGWVLVDAAGTTTWVHLSYLQPERPEVVAQAPAPAPAAPRVAAPPQSTQPSPAPVSQPRIEKVLVYRDHLIPLSQLTYRSADFGPILMTPTGPRAGSYVCPVYNYSAPVVRTVSGVILEDPDPLGCGFARADQAVIRDALIQ